jgi:hypothetical protein
LLELFVEYECEGGELTDGLVRVTWSHVILRCMFTLVFINEKQLISFSIVRELQRPALVMTAQLVQ